ncbi:MAG TPA: nucleotidyltransferase domain-containing protein [Blastocatellia bacterium]|nr:nucleotidyltransferase domain-containing protein [Blastocatellia bacterium]
METTHPNLSANIATLKLPDPAKQALEEFALKVQEMYSGDLVSIAVFGSAVTGDYDEGESDVNVLIVHSELDIADLEHVADLSRQWLQKKRIAPRFLSRRNLVESARYFQIDFLEMRDAHVVLWGEDVLAAIELLPAELRWQIGYEIKAMRMRLKQVFWRTAGDNKMMKAALVARFTSLLHIVRALLLLKKLKAPLTREEIIAEASRHLALDRQIAEQFLRLRRSTLPSDARILMGMFGDLMEMIRLVDARVEEVQL